MNQLAADAGPDPFSSFSLDEPAQFPIFAGVKRAETMSTILVLEVMARIELTIATGSLLYGLICDPPHKTWIISDQSVSTQLDQPASLIYAIYGPRKYIQLVPMSFLEEPGVGPLGKYGICTSPYRQINRMYRQ